MQSYFLFYRSWAAKPAARATTRAPVAAFELDEAPLAVGTVVGARVVVLLDWFWVAELMVVGAAELEAAPEEAAEEAAEETEED